MSFTSRKYLAGSICVAIISASASLSAHAGTYTLYSNNSVQSIKNNTITLPTINATYYRNLTVSYQANMWNAFSGYLWASIEHSCNGNVYAVKPVTVRGPNGYASYSENPGCQLGNVNIVLDGNFGWANPGDLYYRNIAVSGIKDPPVANAQSLSVTQGSSSASTALNASDPQSAPMTKTVTQAPANGSLSWSGLNFVYTPNTCFSGTDTFKYTVAETIQSQSSSEATVTINVASNPPQPTLGAISNITIPWYASQAVSLSGIAKGTCSPGPITVTATSSNPTLLPNPVVSYSNPGATGSIELKPRQPSVVSSNNYTVTVTVNDGLYEVSRNFSTTVQWVNVLFRK